MGKKEVPLASGGSALHGQLTVSPSVGLGKKPGARSENHSLLPGSPKAASPGGACQTHVE